MNLAPGLQWLGTPIKVKDWHKMQNSSICHPPATLLLEKDFEYPLGRRMSGPHSSCGHGEKEKVSAPIRN